MAESGRQVRMVFDLNKCLGCQACTMACKTMWTDSGPGLLYQYWNNVETRPGRGYPREYWKRGGGFRRGELRLPKADQVPSIRGDYGAPWDYNYDEVLEVAGGNQKTDRLRPHPPPDGEDAYAANWDEDVGLGSFPNSYYFYLPRVCNHCTNPGCVAACPRQAIYKRPEDGIVLIDQDRCRGYRYCIQGCPYKKVFYNPELKRSQKCIFCYPRLEDSSRRKGNFCVTQCVGRVRWVGYADDPQANVHKLVDVWKVALRLYPEFGTEPNTFYIPPLSPPVFEADDTLGRRRRIPLEFLADLFGDTKEQSHEDRVKRVVEVLETLEAERKKVAGGARSELVDILVSRSESDRIQV